jgi:hypothetical protein
MANLYRTWAVYVVSLDGSPLRIDSTDEYAAEMFRSVRRVKKPVTDPP